jgi:hypothetical protein
VLLLCVVEAFEEKGGGAGLGHLAPLTNPVDLRMYCAYRPVTKNQHTALPITHPSSHSLFHSNQGSGIELLKQRGYQ